MTDTDATSFFRQAAWSDDEALSGKTKAAVDLAEGDWHSHRQYLAEDHMNDHLLDHETNRLAHQGHAQRTADKITDAEGLPRIKVLVHDSPNVSGRGTTADGSPVIALGENSLKHSTLIHELTHHKRQPSEDDPDHSAGGFYGDYIGMLQRHHPDPDAYAHMMSANKLAVAHMRAHPDKFPPRTAMAFFAQAATDGLTAGLREAYKGDTPYGTLVRGMNVSLPADKHSFIHDERQPLPARAHLLLSELKKPTGSISNEELKGSSGGLGEFWTRNHLVSDDAAATQHEERPPGERSTNVTLHAHEPGGKHFWNEMTDGHGDYEGNWRVPLRPGTPLGVHAITWGEPGGTQHHYDFSHSVDKHAAAVDNSGGVMVALVPPREVAEQLAMKDGQPVDDLHVTLAYLGKASDYTPEQLKLLPQIVSSWALRQKPVDMRIGGTGKFNNSHKGQHVLYAAVDIPGGAQMHSDLARYLQGHGYELPSEHGWTPHLTLAYVDRHFRFMPHLDEHRWTADQVVTEIGQTRHQARLGTIPSGRHQL
ncbi:2'-5' RNA ligase family protein [Streptomyces mirabilis]|uniref:2'-5' RNA ligase family protein n=1 Tax=Streptomyces mirabilis TaxID=68239 RepID=UPI00367A0EE6